MIRNSLFLATLAAVLVTAAGAPRPALADDAEIYINDDVPPEAQPLVMFSIDWRPNLTSTVCSNGECQFLVDEGFLPQKSSYTFFEMLRAALQKVMEPLTGLRVGLMFNHDSRNNCEGPAGAKRRCANGGYIAMGFRPFTVADRTDPNKQMFDAVLQSMPLPQGNQSHFYQGRELFFEFYRYLKGLSVYNGHNGFMSYDGNTGDDSRNINPEYAATWAMLASAPVKGFSWDPTIESGSVMLSDGSFASPGNYISPLTTVGDCTKIFTVNFLFQVSQQENDSDTAITQATGLSSNGDFEQMLRYLNTTDLDGNVDGDQKVISYFLGDERFLGGDARKMEQYAQAGGTGNALPITDDPEELIATLTDIFKQILSISTTFTAAALPINSFDRAQVLDDVFLALFQPQIDQFPANNSYWWGNLKKLKLSGLGSATEVVQLIDARNQPAVAADGRIRFDALTYWSDPNAADVMDLDRDPDENDVVGRDGRSANRGGAGHKQPGYPRYAGYSPGMLNPAAAGMQPATGPRRLFYDSGASTLSALQADATTASNLQSAFGAADSTEALELLNFVRGLYPGTGEPMSWLYGATMHSRPVPVNYGAKDGHSSANPLIYVAVGSNDGVLRFVRNTDVSGNQLGQEVWGFMPVEVMANIRRIVRQEGPGFTGDSTIYGLDGPPTVYVEDQNGDGTVNGADRAIIFVGLRRGGRAYYAIEVTDPEAPQLLWRIEADSTPGFADLGWTFSQPKVGKVDLNGDGIGELAVIFAGGYDRVYDDETTAPPADPLGNGIYVVNGLTGALVRYLQRPEMVDSMPATPAAVDTDGDGFLDRAYIGDLGGKVWRVDLPIGDPADWSVSLLANLGRHATGGAVGGAEDRRFFNQPDVVQAKKKFVSADGLSSTTVNFDAVLLGSGDRANPLYNNANNWFYMIRDLDTAVLSTPHDSAHEAAALTDVTNCVACEVPITSAGWRLQLSTPGEKNLAPPLTVANTVFFTTYLPPGATADGETDCGPAEGSGRLYTVSLQNANPLTNRDEPISDDDASGDPDDRWEELRSGGIPAEVVIIPPDRILRPDLDIAQVPITTRWRTFWYLEEDPVE